MTDDQYRSLPTATHSKLQKYQELLSSTSHESVNLPFWDIVVLTSIDDDQRSCYEQQIQLKKERREIPESVRYLVFSDPPGAKIGNGGATLHVFEQLEKVVGWEELKKARVLLLHAGGYSQRLPSVSVVGKIFMGLPCGNPMFQMLDAMLVMYIDLPARMNPGVFLASSDIFLLYNGTGEWDMKQPGITALAHPLDTQVATRHGVFVFEDIEEIRKRYREDPSAPSSMSKVKQFLHKVSIEKMKANQAIIPESNKVYADLAYYLDFPTVSKLIKFYSEHKPIKCEIDAYGDFLQALGSTATPEYCSNVANVTMVEDGLVEMREKVFQLMQGTQFTAVIFNEAMFNHVGTTQEYLYHFCRNKVLLNSYLLEVEKMVSDVDEGQEDSSELTQPEAKKSKSSSYENCIVMHSVLHGRSSISVGEDSVVEYCIIEKGAKIRRNSIVSNLHIPANAQIPDGSYLHTIPIQVDGATHFATFAFDISDSMKTSVQVEEQSRLVYCGMGIDEAMKHLYGDLGASHPLWPDEVSVYSLWTARLFPIFATRLESSQYAIGMLNCLKSGVQADKLDITSGNSAKRMSVTEMVKSKSIASLLQYHSELRTMILPH